MAKESPCTASRNRAIAPAVSRFKVSCSAVVLIGLLGGGIAFADVVPRRAPTPARTSPKPAAKKLSTAVKAQATPPAPTSSAVMITYQRIGRDIIQLQNFRGTECTLELWKTFRSIKLDDATATSESRIATAATLQELQVRIERNKGITIRQECLNNPLAPECQ